MPIRHYLINSLISSIALAAIGGSTAASQEQSPPPTQSEQSEGLQAPAQTISPSAPNPPLEIQNATPSENLPPESNTASSPPAPENTQVQPPLAQAPASRVTMQIPEGFSPSTRFIGFENSKLNASIVVTERPASSFNDLAKALRASSLASQNIQLATPGKLDRMGDHIYISARQVTQRARFSRHFLLFKDQTSAVLISVNVPLEVFESQQFKKSDVERALASTTLTDVRAPTPLEFGFENIGSLKEVSGYAVRAKLFTTDGTPASSRSGSTQISILISASPDRRSVSNALAIAGPMVFRTSGVAGLQIVSVGRTQIAGFPAVVHDAKGTSIAQPQPLLVRQYFLTRRSGGWYRILVIIPEKDSETTGRELAPVIASFKAPT